MSEEQPRGPLDAAIDWAIEKARRATFSSGLGALFGGLVVVLAPNLTYGWTLVAVGAFSTGARVGQFLDGLMTKAEQGQSALPPAESHSTTGEPQKALPPAESRELSPTGTRETAPPPGTEDEAPLIEGTPYRSASSPQDALATRIAGQWTSRPEWIQFCERVSVALEHTRKSADSMPPHAWETVLGGPMELARRNLQDLSTHLSGLVGWNETIANTRGFRKAYESALQSLGRLGDNVEKDELQEAVKKARNALSTMNAELVTLASAADSHQPNRA